MSHAAENFMVFAFWLSLFAVAYSYVLYPVLLRMLARFFGRPSLSAGGHTPSVSVVIPVHNEEMVIAEKLRNIFAVDYPADKLSVWVGSDCSDDRTDAIVKEWGDSGRVHLWRSATRLGKTGVLNHLVPDADAEIVLFTDADIMLDRGSIRALMRHFADPTIGGVGGVTLQRRQGSVIPTEETAYRRYEADLKALESNLHSTISVFGSFYTIRKKLFMPFHPRTYSNDDVIMPMNVVRQGYRMRFEPEAVSYEEVMPGMKTEFQRRIRIGAGNFQAFFWLLDFLNPARGWPWFCYVSHKVSRWFSPLFLGLAAVSCGVLALSGGPLLYHLLFASGVLVGAAAILHKVIPLPLSRTVFYFMAMNLAIVLGFFRFLAGIRSAVWSPTKRSA
jgi:cellulose synthase/poly-beta-1,6-N-acetylglucosamine synthase-like glycosyltransferase